MAPNMLENSPLPQRSLPREPTMPGKSSFVNISVVDDPENMELALGLLDKLTDLCTLYGPSAAHDKLGELCLTGKHPSEWFYLRQRLATNIERILVRGIHFLRIKPKRA